MLKLKLQKDININARDKHNKGAFVTCSNSLGNFLISKGKAVLTGTFSMDNLTKTHIVIKED